MILASITQYPIPNTGIVRTLICSLEHLFLIIKKVVKLVFSAVPGLAVPKSSPVMGTVISTSARCSTSGAISVSSQDSTSSIVAKLRSPRTCDLRTMVHD